MATHLACTKCRYMLVGLPAAVCSDCGHIYIRCPECGTSLDGNEPRAHLLESLRRFVQYLPGFIQGTQLLGMVVLGTLWVLLGYVGGAVLRQAEYDWLAALLLVLAGGCSALAVRTLVFRWPRALLANVASWAFVSLPWLFGFLVATFSVNGVRSTASVAHSGSLVLIGAAFGALPSEYWARMALWIFLKREDRQRLSRPSGNKELPTDLAFCAHCAADVSSVGVQTCPTCGLGRVSCPGCGRLSPASGTLGAIDLAADVGSRCWASFLLAVRLCIFIGCMISAVAIWDEYRLTRPLWNFIALPNEEGIGMVVVAIALRWLVQPGRSLVGTWALLMVIAAGGGLIESLSHPSYLRRMLMGVPFLTTWAIGGAVVICIAAFLHVLVVSVLPKRRVEIVDEALGTSMASVK